MFDIGSTTLTPTCAEYLATLKEMCGEQVHAYVWLEQLIKSALVWDHLKDPGDKCDPKALDEVMTTIITEWPINQFLRQNSYSLIPTVVASISAWRFSGNQRGLEYEVYRAVPAAVAFILGGNEMVDKYMPRITELVLVMQKEDDLRDNHELDNNQKKAFSTPEQIALVEAIED